MSKISLFTHAAASVLGLTLLASSAQQPPGGVTYEGPVRITKGGTYTGNWQSLDPKIPAVEINTREPVVIEYSNVRSRGPLIRSRYDGANVTVRHTRGVALNPNTPEAERRFPGYFVHLEEFASAVIENNELEGTAGMYFREYVGGDMREQTIRIRRNVARNIDGRYSAGPGRFSDTGFYRVQFVQFNNVRRVPNVEISWNQVINEPGESRVEENINMYGGSSGTPNSPIDIHDNYIQGAYPTRPERDAYSGGGLMLGDGKSSTRTAAVSYIRAFRNQIVSTSNQGIAIAAGHHIEAFDNRVVSSGLLPDGRRIRSQNVGLFVWDLYGDKRRGTFSDNAIYDNMVGWARPDVSATAQNPAWFPDCAASACRNNRVLPGPITRAHEANELVLWRQKVRAANVALGPQAATP